MHVWKKHCKNRKRTSNAPQTYLKRSQQIPQTYLQQNNAVTLPRPFILLVAVFSSGPQRVYAWKNPCRNLRHNPKHVLQSHLKHTAKTTYLKLRPCQDLVDLRFSDASNKKVNAWQKQCTNLNKRISNAPPAPSKYLKSTACTVEGRLNDGFFLTKK